MQQVVYIHGGDAFESREDFLNTLAQRTIDDPTAEAVPFWSKKLQESLGNAFQVIAPAMPNKQSARYDEWKIWFDKHLPYLKENCVFVGWSLGANFLAKYIAEEQLPVSSMSLHLVAGCYGYVSGFELSDISSLCAKMKSITIYHSKDDPIVSFSDAERYRDALPCAHLVAFEDRNHFFQAEFPELIERIQKTAQ